MDKNKQNRGSRKIWETAETRLRNVGKCARGNRQVTVSHDVNSWDENVMAH